MTRIIEYVHEYDEPDWEYVKGDGEVEGRFLVTGERVDYISRVQDTYYAISEAGNYARTNRDGEVEQETFGDSMTSWVVNGTNLTIYNREDLLGYIGLLTKLLDEFPEEEK